MTPSGQDLLLHPSDLSLTKTMPTGMSRRLKMYLQGLAHSFLAAVTGSNRIKHDTLTKPI